MNWKSNQICIILDTLPDHSQVNSATLYIYPDGKTFEQETKARVDFLLILPNPLDSFPFCVYFITSAGIEFPSHILLTN